MQFTVLLLSIIGIVFGEVTCPDDYSTFDNTTCYKVYPLSVTRDQAVTQCESDGGYLASISNGFTRSYLLQLGQNAEVPNVWLGVECFNGNKSSCVNDDGTRFTGTTFAPNNPSVVGNCVYMSVIAKQSGYWFSAKCNSLAPFVCEYKYGSSCQENFDLFRGNCYQLLDPSNATEAEKTCQNNCGELVSIHSDTENNYIISLNGTTSYQFDMIRIGLKGVPGTQNNQWLDQSPFNYSQIGYRNTNVGKCFEMDLLGRLVDPGQWVSANCATQTPSLCKSPANTICTTVLPTMSPSKCSHTQFYEGNGTIYSPGFPASYRNNDHCSYFISTDPGTLVAVTFAVQKLVAGSVIYLYDDESDTLPFANMLTHSPLTIFEIELTLRMVECPTRHRREPQPQCPEGYTMHDNNMCYTVYPQRLKAAPAEAKCQQTEGGHLASITSAELNAFLINLSLPFSANSVDAFWIGLKCNSPVVSTCSWIDNQPLNYTNFATGDPYDGYPWTSLDLYYKQWKSNTGQAEFMSICQAPSIWN